MVEQHQRGCIVMKERIKSDSKTLSDVVFLRHHSVPEESYSQFPLSKLGF